MAASLVAGIMDWRVMAAATVAIAAERMSPPRVSMARVIGVATVGMGMFLLVQGVREPRAVQTHRRLILENRPLCRPPAQR